ncbi:sensor histidine kinase [uncultured Roseibium sp.]|uniref:sensor histidine kinase n=1 Tax=uncultured Roseibium sp. TaxID=1936171 RepID=UPI00261F63A3|nr:sensor histidine kinase [uncultured Roseibium sp.]
MLDQKGEGDGVRAVIAYFLVCLSVVFATVAASAAPQTLQLKHNRPVENVGEFMGFAEDRKQALAELAAQFKDSGLSDSFESVASKVVPYQGIWGLLAIKGPEPVPAQTHSGWFLASDIYGLIALDVFLIRSDGTVEQLLNHDIRRAFNPDDYSMSRLRSASIVLGSGEEAIVATRMVHGAIEEVDFALEPPAVHQENAFASGLKLAGFYAFLGSCLIFFFAFSIAMKSIVEFSYALLLMLGLGFVSYLDNFPFRWLYPDLPDIHLSVGLVLLLLVIAQGYFCAGLSLQRYASRQRFHMQLFWAGAGALGAIVLVFFLPAEFMAPFSYVLLAGMLLAQVYAVFQWDAFNGARKRVVRWVTAITITGFTLVIVLAIFRMGIEEISIPWFIKGVYATLAFGVMAGLSTGLVELRREHARALNREIEAVRKEADVARELLRAEQNYSRVRELAEKRQLQLATMSHDIKQPLSALRMTVEAMTRDETGATRARLHEAFDYIQNLALEHLEDARPDMADESTDNDLDRDQSDPQPYGISLILETVGQMFRDEATSKDLNLVIVESSVQISVQPLALMRIASNLVSNAIKYTEKGKVLAGVRRRGDNVLLQVIDTGPGMSEAELTQFRKAWKSGKDSEGHGLGLAICMDLASQNGLVLDVSSEPGRGTLFSLRIPTAFSG